MLYSTTVIVVSVVLSIAAIYTFGRICYNAGRQFGIKVGYSAGRAVERQEAILSNLQDEACIQLFDEVMGEDTCPVCMDAPIAKGQGACNGCLCDLYPDDPRSIHHAAGLPIGDSDEWKQWVDFGDDDAPNARVAPSDIPF
jgi:hypothetical protein